MLGRNLQTSVDASLPCMASKLLSGVFSCALHLGDYVSLCLQYTTYSIALVCSRSTVDAQRPNMSNVVFLLNGAI